MKRSLIAVLFSCALAVSATQAQEILQLSSDQAVAMALESNLGIKAEGLKLQVKARDRDFAWNKFLPSINGSATLSRSNVETTASGLVPISPATVPGVGTVYDGVMSYSKSIDPVNLSTSLNIQLGLSVALFRGIEQTVLDYEAASISRDVAKERLSRDVRKSFYTLLAQQEALGLAEKQLESARLRFVQNQASFKSGLIPELTVLQSQVAWENRKPALEDQKLGYQQTMLGLKNLLGLPLERELQLLGSIEIPAIDVAVEDSKLIAGFINRRLDLLSLKAQQASINNMVKLQQDTLWPMLVLMASFDPGLNAPFDSTSWNNSDNWKQRASMLGVSLTWKLDALIPGSTAWVQTENLKTQAAQLEISQQQALRGAAMEVKVLLTRLKKSAQSLATLDLSVALARKAYELSDKAYKAGGQSLLEVRDAELQLQAAQLQVLNEKLTFNNGLLDLEGTLGTPWREIFKENKQ